jgi:hypothetical protein
MHEWQLVAFFSFIAGGVCLWVAQCVWRFLRRSFRMLF